MKLIFRTEKPAQPGCPSAHPEQAPKLAQVKLIPEARSEPTGPPPDRHYYCSWPTRGGESIPSPCSWSQAHQAALQLPRSQKHSSKAKWLWDNKTPPLKSMGFIGIAQGWFSRRFSAYVLACPSVGKGTAQKQTGKAENRRLRKKKQRFVVFYLDNQAKLLLKSLIVLQPVHFAPTQLLREKERGFALNHIIYALQHF